MPAVISKVRPASNGFDKIALLRNNPLFRELAPAVLEPLGNYMTRRTVRRGTPIFAKGDPGNGLMAVITGLVKISVPSTDGREVVLNIIQDGDVFGEIALLDGHPRTADATAMSDCELLVMERRDFIPFVREHPDVAVKFIEVLCARLRRTSEQVEDVLFLNLPGRLAKALLRLSQGNGSTATRRKVIITQREISQIIGTSRESTNRLLREWERRKWVLLERGGIIVLAPDALAEVAADGQGSDLT